MGKLGEIVSPICMPWERNDSDLKTKTPHFMAPAFEKKGQYSSNELVHGQAWRAIVVSIDSLHDEKKKKK